MIKILIADDHYLIREGLKNILERESDLSIVAELDKGADVCEFIKNKNCDLVILDINLPDRNGLDVLKDLKVIKPELKVLVLSILPEDQFAIRTIRAGASGYLTKDSAPDELIKAVRRVIDGRRFVSQELADKLAFDLNIQTDKILHEKLSDREFQILLLIGSGETSKKIAEILSLGVSTVNTYKSRIFEKMEMTTTSQLIQYVLKNELLK